jgi:DNA-binding transcriptional ArsR family regulator
MPSEGHNPDVCHARMVTPVFDRRRSLAYTIFMYLNMKARATQAQLLKTLSHPTRLAVLEILREGEQCVCHMEAMLGLRQASLSQQLMVLREAGLVSVRRDGLNVYYRVLKHRVFEVLDALNAAAGRSRTAIRHRHGPSECPCPKCNRPRRTLVVPTAGIKVQK